MPLDSDSDSALSSNMDGNEVHDKMNLRKQSSEERKSLGKKSVMQIMIL